ncbi:hypothetical protein MYOV065v1_p0039 [Vibrio phage PS15B.2]|nr:hypothetical protein MYOV065v1_p0039 [Vibrio phage PS15B.2]QZI90822.1 hypothetical protein MYOV066v1_p0044 [Vibrio phage PS15B.3]QZI90889.1 hypothetical protein MYOV064v1_p0039 [Vibrio phage PS15B.4]
MSKSKLNGHEIEHNGTEWVFSDTGESTIKTHNKRPCGHCNKHAIADGDELYDACIGKVDGLINACCGHGDVNKAYAQLSADVILRGNDAIKYFEDDK